jgi:hypothetical protein
MTRRAKFSVGESSTRCCHPLKKGCHDVSISPLTLTFFGHSAREAEISTPRPCLVAPVVISRRAFCYKALENFPGLFVLSGSICEGIGKRAWSTFLR